MNGKQINKRSHESPSIFTTPFNFGANRKSLTSKHTHTHTAQEVGTIHSHSHTRRARHSRLANVELAEKNWKKFPPKTTDQETKWWNFNEFKRCTKKIETIPIWLEIWNYLLWLGRARWRVLEILSSAADVHTSQSQRGNYYTEQQSNGFRWIFYTHLNKFVCAERRVRYENYNV